MEILTLFKGAPYKAIVKLPADYVSSQFISLKVRITDETGYSENWSTERLGLLPTANPLVYILEIPAAQTVKFQIGAAHWQVELHDTNYGLVSTSEIAMQVLRMGAAATAIHQDYITLNLFNGILTAQLTVMLLIMPGTSSKLVDVQLTAAQDGDLIEHDHASILRAVGFWNTDTGVMEIPTPFTTYEPTTVDFTLKTGLVGADLALQFNGILICLKTD